MLQRGMGRRGVVLGDVADDDGVGVAREGKGRGGTFVGVLEAGLDFTGGGLGGLPAVADGVA
jgi:hypothetical protein